MRRPEITVVIPTRGRRPSLSAALASALAQESVDLEVVVVDDGSTHAPDARLAEPEQPRMRLLRHGGQKGVAAARNVGIEAAEGSWVAFLDDDDLWAPDKLRTQLDAAAGRRAQFVYSAAMLIDAHRRGLEVMGAPDPDHVAVDLLARNVMPAGSSNVLAQTDLLRRLGGFDESLSQLADWDMWIRLATEARAAACSRVHVAYTQHPGNWLLVDDGDPILELEHLAAKHRAAHLATGVTIDRVSFSRWVAWGQRRRGRRLAASQTYLRYGWKYQNLGNVARAAAVLLGERAMTRGAAGARLPAPEWLSDG